MKKLTFISLVIGVLCLVSSVASAHHGFLPYPLYRSYYPPVMVAPPVAVPAPVMVAPPVVVPAAPVMVPIVRPYRVYSPYPRVYYRPRVFYPPPVVAPVVYY